MSPAQADGPPTLPPFMLADGVAAQSATYAVMMALYHRDVHGGEGQLVDVSLIEPLARLVEQATLAYDQLGKIQGRTGNRADASAPRNAYRTSDDRWIAISSASSSVAARLYRAIDRPDLATRPEYVDPIPRQARAEEIDGLVAEWIRARTLDHAMKIFLAEDVAAAPIYDAQQLLADEHLARARDVRDRRRSGLGRDDRPGAGGRLSETPGRVAHLGRALGADNEAVYRDLLGLDADRLRSCARRAPSEPKGAGHVPRPGRAAASSRRPRATSTCARSPRAAGADLVFLDLEDACARRQGIGACHGRSPR